ncbi:hypothetical protein DENSPDRAFT_72671 [Dentipellis sp. KUC8613]|nr:hypothetical protein DENSPDRAFT_72671 [Dentipellis sp. KUC8613]
MKDNRKHTLPLQFTAMIHFSNILRETLVMVERRIPTANQRYTTSKAYRVLRHSLPSASWRRMDRHVPGRDTMHPCLTWNAIIAGVREQAWVTRRQQATSTGSIVPRSSTIVRVCRPKSSGCMAVRVDKPRRGWTRRPPEGTSPVFGLLLARMRS